MKTYAYGEFDGLTIDSCVSKGDEERIVAYYFLQEPWNGHEAGSLVVADCQLCGRSFKDMAERTVFHVIDVPRMIGFVPDDACDTFLYI